MATLPVKFYHSSMPGAPILNNNWGDMTALLDACLINGFNTININTITYSGGIATATYNTTNPAPFLVDSVIKIIGANQTEYNGEFRVISANTTSITFAVSGTPITPATGTITAKIPPLGFEILYTATNKRVYRSTDPSSTKPLLRVDDSLPTNYTTTYAKFARVTIAEGMSDIDTFVGARAPYDPLLPTKNEIPTGTGTSVFSGWYKWYYGASGAADSAGDGGAFARTWLLIGDSRMFYLFSTTGWYGACMNAFGELVTYKSTSSIYDTVLMAADWYAAASTTGISYIDQKYGQKFFSSNYIGNALLSGINKDFNTTRRFNIFGLNVASTATQSGQSMDFPYPNLSNSIVLVPTTIREEAIGVVRGKLPGSMYMHNGNALSYLSIFGGVDNYPNKKFIIAKLTNWSANESPYLTMAFDITGPWR